MSLYNFIRKITPPTAKKYLRAILQKNNYIILVKKTLGLKQHNPEDIVRIWQIAESSNSSDARAIYLKLSKIRPSCATSYTLSALAKLRLDEFTASCETFEKGIKKYPEDHWLRLYYTQTCGIRNQYPRYAAFMRQLLGSDADAVASAVSFYKEVIKSGELLSFIINFHNIKADCTPDDFKLLQRLFLATLAQKPVSLHNAKSILFLGKHSDIGNDFFQMIYDILRKPYAGAQEYSQKTAFTLKILASLTLPFTPTNEAIAEFIGACKQLATDSITLSEPSKDLLWDWSPWQFIFTCPDAGLSQYSEAMAAFEQFAFTTWPQLNYTSPHTIEPFQPSAQANRKIRIGFLVHDTMPMLSGLLRRFDRKIFDTVYLRPGKAGTSQTAKNWMLSADEIVEYSTVDTQSAIETIAAQKLDIIISGPCTVATFFPMMARLASLQMVLLEPNWTDGMTNTDYYISWRPAEPVKPEDFYKAAVSYLEHPPYWIERPALDPNPAFSKKARNDVLKKLLNCEPENHIYLCANTPPKIHPQMDEMFADLLKADPQAMIVVLRSEMPSGKILKARLQDKLGQDFNRVIFLTTLAKQDAHSLLMSVDCCLDSFPLCGMSSSFDAVMLGVPVVTLPFGIPFGRWTASIYEYLGISDLTARDQKEYIQLAMRVANDASWREQKAKEIREKSSLYVESTAAFEELQQFLIKAWERKLLNLPPSNWINGSWQES